MSEEHYITVEAEDDGQRLDRWLKKRVPEMPYALVQKLVRKGAIKSDGKKLKRDSRLTEGQSIRIPPIQDKVIKPKKKRPFSQGDLDYLLSQIIYDDGDIVALNKLHGLASQGGSGIRNHVDGLLELIPDKKGRRPRLIHRLDRDTSGVLLCARKSETVRMLGKAFKDRTAQKTYWAIVVPAPLDNQGTVNAPLEKGAGSMRDRMYVSDSKEAKFSSTDFVVIERAAKKAAFVGFMPKTGRTHQIRVHAADVLETPILGDDKYGGSEAVIEGMDLAERLHLHARRLVLEHPGTKEKLDLTAPLPPELEQTWEALGFNVGEADKLCESGYCALNGL